VSTAGIFGLSANASEFTLECGEELPQLAPTTQISFRNDCMTLALFGSPWRVHSSFGFVAAASLMTVSATTFRPYEVLYAGSHRTAARELEANWSGSHPGRTTSLNTNDFQSWYVGFRCAYDDR